MKKLVVLLASILFIPSLVLSGEIYGTIKKGEHSVGQGVTVEIKSGKKVYRQKTDKYGSYSIYVKKTGKCKIRVRGVRGVLNVYSKNDPVRFDMEILRDEDGNYHLRRK